MPVCFYPYALTTEQVQYGTRLLYYSTTVWRYRYSCSVAEWLEHMEWLEYMDKTTMAWPGHAVMLYLLLITKFMFGGRSLGDRTVQSSW